MRVQHYIHSSVSVQIRVYNYIYIRTLYNYIWYAAVSSLFVTTSYTNNRRHSGQYVVHNNVRVDVVWRFPLFARTSSSSSSSELARTRPPQPARAVAVHDAHAVTRKLVFTCMCECTRAYEKIVCLRVYTHVGGPFHCEAHYVFLSSAHDILITAPGRFFFNYRLRRGDRGDDTRSRERRRKTVSLNQRPYQQHTRHILCSVRRGGEPA